jgi:homopolymeric O-antigen transport system permease protein
MNTTYTGVAIERSGESFDISAQVQNTSKQAWLASAGFAFGVHIFDRASETLIIDGPRVPVTGEILPGETMPVSVSFEMPKEPGRYRIFLSPMAEGQAWFYEHGWNFVMVDAFVNEAGEATIERTMVTSSRRLSLERFWRSLGRAFVLPVRAIVQNRSLIHSMVKRDILGRFRGSFGGWFWTVLNPLMMMSTYFFVFGIVLKAKVEGDTSVGAFALYLIAGILPWLAFSEAVGRAPVNMLEHRQFIKKLLFPIETLPVNIMLAGFVSELFGLLIYFAGLLLARGHLPVSILWLPVLVIPQMLFTAGLCWFLAALGVFFRDLAQINGFLLTIWFFLTPICYSEDALTTMPAVARSLLIRNPMYVLVHGYRDLFLRGHAPAWGPLSKLYLLSALVFFFGHAWFHKLKKSFADII